MKKKQKTNDYKMFIVRTYVMAKNVSHAIKLVQGKIPDDVYIDPEWKDNKNRQLSDAIGFCDGYYPE